MNEQLEKLKGSLDAIKASKYVYIRIESKRHVGNDVIINYPKDDKFCGGRIEVFEESLIVKILLLEEDDFETITDVLMKSYQFIDQIEKIYLHKINSPSFKEAFNTYFKFTKQ